VEEVVKLATVTKWDHKLENVTKTLASVNVCQVSVDSDVTNVCQTTTDSPEKDAPLVTATQTEAFLYNVTRTVDVCARREYLVLNVTNARRTTTILHLDVSSAVLATVLYRTLSTTTVKS
jgi:hypothetical protein